MRVNLSKVALRIVFGAFLILLSIRDFLFGNGLYIFRDWTWPLSTSLPPIATFSPDIVRNVSPDPLGFVRMFVTWPIIVIDSLTSDPILAEKAFVVYFLTLFIVLFFVLGDLLLRLWNKVSGDQMKHWREELFVFMVVLLCFVNFWSIQQVSDLYYTAILEFGLIAISATLVLLHESRVRDSLLPGALLALCIFLDPNLFPYGLLVVTTCVLARSFARPRSLSKFRLAITRILVVIVVTIPALVTMLYTFSISTGTNLRPANFYLQSSVNLSLTAAIRLLGYSWSLIAYSPPTVLGATHDIQMLNSVGTPAYVLLPAGALTAFWLITTWTVPVLAFGSNIASRFRRLTLPISCVAVLGLLFTQPMIFPYPFALATQLKSTPVIGGALVTFLAIPDHALVVVAIAYTLLISAGLYHVLSRDIFSGLAKSSRTLGRFKLFHMKSPTIGQIIPVLIIALLLVFQGWQFFSGSFYPSGFVWGGSGNGISTVGAFAPSQPPPEMVQVYNWLYSQPDNFNIYWPGPSGANYSWSPQATGAIASQDAPKPTVFPRALPYLLSGGLTGDVSDYLASLNVKYLIVQPFSRTAMEFWWGVGDPNTLNQILAGIPGMGIAKEVGEITVYVVSSTWGTMYSSPVVASYNATDQRYALAYTLFSSLGTRIVLTTPGTAPDQLCMDNLTCTYAIVAPLDRGVRSSYERSVFILNDTSATWQSLDLKASYSRPMPSPWSAWLITNWGPGDAAVGIQDGNMLWSFNQARSYLSLSYNGTVTSGNPGGITIPSGLAAEVQAGFWYRNSATFDGTVQIVIPQFTQTGSWISDTVSPAMAPSTEWNYISFNDTLPFDTSYFTARFVAQGSSGWVEIRDAGMNVSFLQEDPQAPFGYNLPLQKGNLYLGNIERYSYVEFDGNGSLSLNNQTYELLSPAKVSWYAIPLAHSSVIVLSGINIHAFVISQVPIAIQSNDSTVDGGWSPNLTIRSNSAVVFTRPFAKGYLLRSSSLSYTSLPTLDGVNAFLEVTPGSYTVALPGTRVALVAYLSSLALILGIIVTAGRTNIATFLRNLKKRSI